MEKAESMMQKGYNRIERRMVARKKKSTKRLAAEKRVLIYWHSLQYFKSLDFTYTQTVID